MTSFYHPVEKSRINKGWKHAVCKMNHWIKNFIFKLLGLNLFLDTNTSHKSELFCDQLYFEKLLALLMNTLALSTNSQTKLYESAVKRPFLNTCLTYLPKAESYSSTKTQLWSSSSAG